MKNYLIILCISNLIFHEGMCQNLETMKDQKPFDLAGSISARTILYHASGINNRRDPFAYILNGNISASFFGIALPFSFTYSNQGSIYGQPFNQFGMSPTYRWATLHLGYRNINHSSYTLAGHQLLGAGVDLNPGKLRFGFMAGRLLRAVGFDQDTTLLSLRMPTFQRTGWSAKIGYGTNSNFIDLIIFKAEDDPGSLPDDIPVAGITPAENLVIGINTRQRFLKYFTFYFDGAISSYVRDKTLNAEPVELPSLLNLTRNFINLNSSAQVLSAFKTGISYNGSIFSIDSYFQKIDPDFQSMGIYFINNDLQALGIAPSLVLFQNKLRLNTSLTLIRDNLQNTKISTTQRTLPQVSVSYNPLPTLGLNATYTNMSVLQQEGVLPLDNALKMDQENPIYSFNAYYSIINQYHSHQFNFMYNHSELIDNNLFTREFANYSGTIMNLSYNYNLNEANLNLNASFNSNNIKTFNGNLPGTGFSLGGSKGFHENKLNVNGNLSFSFQDETASQSLFAGLNYRLEQQVLGLQVNYLNTVFSEFDYNELTGFLQYSYRFK